jgi:hypothetical protein
MLQPVLVTTSDRRNCACGPQGGLSVDLDVVLTPKNIRVGDEYRIKIRLAGAHRTKACSCFVLKRTVSHSGAVSGAVKHMVHRDEALLCELVRDKQSAFGSALLPCNVHPQTWAIVWENLSFFLATIASGSAVLSGGTVEQDAPTADMLCGHADVLWHHQQSPWA